ncbi:hypothetical protein CORC01_06318 [Colletotrichum orchidophilum]|uniref:Biotrophy-associated secreted protein 2 n=1 Tax=Colletotrichum orchidophilum TaxID=1209926 RepID=A0A1G4BAK0_9PEZI|nr:uncharacterized protein CORC01_06318 [Colletotrichum orchidophilum]OHE98322.1 hypothetical protein CORC01_06318 [Colletotrichum orchidophilum]
MHLSGFAFALLLVSEVAFAAPRPRGMRGEALAITLIPREFSDFAKRNKPSAQQIAANGHACGNAIQQGVCDNGRCGNFVAPTGFEVVPGADSQCGGVV